MSRLGECGGLEIPVHGVRGRGRGLQGKLTSSLVKLVSSGFK